MQERIWNITDRIKYASVEAKLIKTMEKQKQKLHRCHNKHRSIKLVLDVGKVVGEHFGSKGMAVLANRRGFEVTLKVVPV